MLQFIQKLIDPNERAVNKVRPIIEQINQNESKVKNKSLEELRSMSNALREQVKKEIAEDNSDRTPIEKEQVVLDTHLPYAFAIVREVFSQVLGERSYDEQLMVGVFLHKGHAAEQKTGEGKTHAAVHPMYLNALSGRGAHLVTVNDYLSKRDAEWMGVVYHHLGLTVGCVNSNQQSFLFDGEKLRENTPEDGNWRAFPFGHGSLLKDVSRREAYQADITYGTNNEFGFDYLRDNMVHSLQDQVQSNSVKEMGVHHFAIVDEVDSILIDEARTPLIISQPAQESNALYKTFAGHVKKLNSEDYDLDEKTKGVFLTDLGVKKMEKYVGTENLFEDFTFAHHLEQALKAQIAYERDKDYVVQEGEVKIVDEFTGRILEGRRYSEGLHQAIEAKEQVDIQKESKTVATVTYQNYFRLYEKLSGMSATIMTEAEEFHKIYELDSISVPTHRDVARKDETDRVYKHQRAKWKAIVDEVARINETGQPVLIGTTSVDNNELVSQLLKRRGVPHEILNAKNHAREAEIITAAGRKGAVTVATNMAGRGTDIKIGDDVKAMGGLYVIGTERHEARRIDNQLRGRSGRQGDPGSSRFFVALDDQLMRIFGGDRIAGIMTRFNLPEDMPIETGIISRSIESAQQKVEGYNFDIRKHLVEYDDVINKQREIIYKRRRRLIEMNEDGLDSSESQTLELELLEKAQVYADDSEKFKIDLEEKKKLIGDERFSRLLLYIFLTTVDHLWMDHIDNLDELRSGVGLRGYGQRDPLVEFKNEGFRLFEQLIIEIDDEIVRRFTNMRIEMNEQPQLKRDNVLEKANTKHERLGQFQVKEDGQNQQQQLKPEQGTVIHQGGTYEKPRDQNIGRNDPCPCGSGKKWKKCGMINAPEHKT